MEELLNQADQLIARQDGKASTYSAMAESLALAWRELNGQLEQRRLVLAQCGQIPQVGGCQIQHSVSDITGGCQKQHSVSDKAQCVRYHRWVYFRYHRWMYVRYHRWMSDTTGG